VVRRKPSFWIWVLLGLFSIAGLVLFVVHHNQREDRVEQPVVVRVQRTLTLLFCILFLYHVLLGFSGFSLLNLVLSIVPI
jgi:alpha-1,4-galacturonosyltransferase